MRKTIISSCLFFFCFVLGLNAAAWAAAERKIDSTSYEAYQEAIVAIYNSLEGNEQVLFGKAAAYYRSLFEWGFQAGKDDPEILNRTNEILKSFNGKSSDDLIDTYIVVVQRNLEMAEAERTEAAKLVENANRMNAELDKFEITAAYFYFDEFDGNKVPMIYLLVKNNSPHTINHLYFNAKVLSKGRIIPWFEEEFNFGISGGVKPGEVCEWDLMTDAAAGWDTIPKRDDLEIKLDLVKFTTKSGQTIEGYALPKEQDDYFKLLNEQIEVFKSELAELKALS